MRDTISIVMPAYRAEATIVRAVASALAQSHPHWELLIISDDQTDYKAVLAHAGIADQRLRFLTTGAIGSGSSAARNVALDVATTPYVAILDADDVLHPEKLERALAVLPEYGIVSTALQVMGPDMSPLRQVGAGPDCILDAGSYKFTNFSMDSMLVYDREKADPRFDVELMRLTDIDFLLKLFAVNPQCFHLGAPLHQYVKEPQSVSNRPGASARLITAKAQLLQRLRNGYYPLADPGGLGGMIRFWEISQRAEEAYASRLAANPGLLFEDHLAPRLKAASTSNA